MNRLLALIKQYSHVLVFLLLEGAALLLMGTQTYYQQSRLVRWGNSISGGIHTAITGITGYFGLKKENRRLADENAWLRQQIAESYISYDEKVFTINDTTYKQTYRYITAKVIKSSWNQARNYMMINKGRRHGVMPDMGVISPEGLVGVVVQSSTNFATIMPILHVESRNSVQLERINTSGTLLWEGDNFLYATVVDIPTTHPLATGDTVITSGLDPRFPKGISVGYVDEATSQAGSGFYDIRLRLSTHFDQLDNVYVVGNMFAEEQDTISQ